MESRDENRQPFTQLCQCGLVTEAVTKVFMRPPPGCPMEHRYYCTQRSPFFQIFPSAHYLPSLSQKMFSAARGILNVAALNPPFGAAVRSAMRYF
jgi:hypothetical protein